VEFGVWGLTSSKRVSLSLRYLVSAFARSVALSLDFSALHILWGSCVLLGASDLLGLVMSRELGGASGLGGLGALVTVQYEDCEDRRPM
jgi:hypothetical protein